MFYTIFFKVIFTLGFPLKRVDSNIAQWHAIFISLPNLKQIWWYLDDCIFLRIKYNLSLIILFLILGFIVPPAHIYSAAFPSCTSFFSQPGFILLYSAFAVQFSFYTTILSLPLSFSTLLESYSVWCAQGLSIYSSRIKQSLYARHTYFY